MTRHGISTSGLPQPTAVFIADSAPKPFGRALTPRRRWLRAVIAAAGSALFVAMAFAPGATAQNQGHPLVALQSLHPIVQQVLPAVVNVSVATSGGPEGGFAGPGGAEFGPNFPTPPFDEFLRRYFGEQGLPGEPFWPGRPRGLENVSLGSGFIIDRAGYVVTDYHVVERAGRITVVLQDNSRHPAKLVGCDALSDLALLKIDGGGPFPSLQWGDSDAAQVGDWVMAVGNPFGLGGTVTAGIISARGRNIQAGPYDFLQIDAPINRGNSGGPTFNMDGHVIGVNTAILSPSGGFIGIGFAIPSSVAKPVIDQLREHGTVERGWLGLQIQPLTADIAESSRSRRRQRRVGCGRRPRRPRDLGRRQAGRHRAHVRRQANRRAARSLPRRGDHPGRPRNDADGVAQRPRARAPSGDRTGAVAKGKRATRAAVASALPLTGARARGLRFAPLTDGAREAPFGLRFRLSGKGAARESAGFSVGP